jgi:hypothetical protein
MTPSNADLLRLIERIYANAAESPEWIRARIDEALQHGPERDPMDDVNYVGHPMHY